jgi:ribosome silencing factor RsfS/YbeB/iojap
VPQPKKKTARKPTRPAKPAAKKAAKAPAKAPFKAPVKVAGKAAAKAAPRKPKKSGTPPVPLQPSLQSVVIAALEDMKALEIKVLDVRGLTDIADTMVIASGTSDRHVRSVAQRVVEKTKQAGFRPHGVEGQQDSDWVLIDLHDLIVHVMLPRVREFYGLEKLWDLTASKRAAARA